MLRFLTSCLVGALALTAAAGAGAQLLPALQTRTVAASATAAFPTVSDSDDDSASAPDFGPFADEVTASASIAPTGAGTVASEGRARQDSAIGSSLVSAHGEATVTMDAAAGTTAEAQGTSFFELIFAVDVLSSYQLSGRVDVQAIVTGGTPLPSLGNELRFEDVGNSVTLFETLTDDEAFTIAGVIAPGTYRLLSAASASGSVTGAFGRTASGVSSFELELALAEVPEPVTATSLGFGLAALARIGRRRRR